MIKYSKILKNAAMLVLCAAALTSCEPESIDNPVAIEDITGSWACSEKSQVFGSSTYDVTVTKSPSSSSQIRIQNFYHLPGGFVNVNVSGNDLTIPQQTVQSIVFSGSGTIVNPNRINLSYTADDGGGTVDQVTSGLSK